MNKSKSQERVDEGLVEVIMETVGFGMSKEDAEGFARNIQSYLQESGWAKTIKIGRYIGEKVVATIEYVEDNINYLEAIKKGTKIALLEE